MSASATDRHPSRVESSSTPTDTQRRLNYRPTPLPADHFRNSPTFAPTAMQEGRGGSRWLSEDEGGSSIPRGSASHSFAMGDHGNIRSKPKMKREDSVESSGSAGSSSSGASLTAQVPSSLSRRISPGLAAAKLHIRMLSGVRQRLRRANSQEAESSVAQRSQQSPQHLSSASSGHPIAAPESIPVPNIRDLVPPRRSEGGVTTFEAAPPPTSLLPAATSSAVTTQPPSQSQPERVVEFPNQIPDFAAGYGGDGVSGHGIPTEQNTQTIVEQAEEQRVHKMELIEKLKTLMGCPLCPSSAEGHYPLLHQPVTLRCGHTVSDSHVALPNLVPPDLSLVSSSEAYSAMAAYQHKRLSLWVNITCPLPSCSQRRSPEQTAASTPSGSNVRHQQTIRPMSSSPASSSSSSADVLLNTETLSLMSRQTSDHNLQDVSVGKVLSLVMREAERAKQEDRSGFMFSFNDQLAADQLLSDEDLGDQDDTEDADDEDDDKDGGQSHSSPTRQSYISAGTQAYKRRRSSGRPSVSSVLPPTKRSGMHSRTQNTYGLARSSQTSPSSLSAFEKELSGILECDVCACMLHEPVTTPCQHTFCTKCLARSLDHSNKCPLCRHDLPTLSFFQDHAVNKVITSVLLTAFPAECAERKANIERDERDARLDTPIFVCALAFPGMPTILHVFEPRYRLMLRRCVESGRPQFGMVLPARGTGGNPALNGVMEYGTMLNIKSIQMLPDGRSMVETHGSYRFRLLEKGSLDGYTVGRVERIDDISAEDEAELERQSIARARRANAAAKAAEAQTKNSKPKANASSSSQQGQGSSNRPVAQRAQSMSTSNPVGSPSPSSDFPFNGPAASTPGGAGGLGGPNSLSSISPEQLPDIEPSTDELMEICQSFVEQLRSGSAPWLLQRLNNTYGPMPNNPVEFSYWMALVMPIDEYDKARLLPIRSSRLRLRLIVHWVEQLRSNWWFNSGCVVG